MIINDSAAINVMLKSRLEASGFSVDLSSSGEDGLEKAGRGGYKLILLDYTLPGMNGSEVCRALKSDNKTSEMPVVFISAKDENEVKEIATNSSADGFISTQLKGDELISRVKGFIKKTVKEKAHDGAAAPDKYNKEELILYEDECDEHEAAKEPTLQLVVFRIADEWYGVEITNVKSVVKVKSITFLPSSPESVVGIMNLRGNILSVTDIKKIFGLEPSPITEKSRLVVVEAGFLETGLLVDETSDVIEVPLKAIDPTLTTISSDIAECFSGECRIDNKLIGVLNVEKILQVGRVRSNV